MVIVGEPSWPLSIAKARVRVRELTKLRDFWLSHACMLEAACRSAKALGAFAKALETEADLLSARQDL